jgi:hypothetical protein
MSRLTRDMRERLARIRLVDAYCAVVEGEHLDTNEQLRRVRDLEAAAGGLAYVLERSMGLGNADPRGQS